MSFSYFPPLDLDDLSKFRKNLQNPFLYCFDRYTTFYDFLKADKFSALSISLKFYTIAN